VISKSKITKFTNWLSAQGAEVLPVTSEYELLRFRCKHGTGVVYSGKKGISVSCSFVIDAYECYKNGKAWDGKGKRSKSSNGYKLALLKRDGNDCFYCGQTFEDDELTVEHILSSLHKGSNRIENKALSCKPCNLEAGHKSVVDKVKLRDIKREYVAST